MSQILYAVLLLIGLVLAGFAYMFYKKTQNLIQNGIIVEATVIDLIASRGSKSTTYKPVFEYYDISNNRRTFTSTIGSSPPSFKVGEKATLIYNPANEATIKVVGYWGLYRWTIILLAIASPMIIIGGGYFLYTMNDSIAWQ